MQRALRKGGADESKERCFMCSSSSSYDCWLLMLRLHVAIWFKTQRSSCNFFLQREKRDMKIKREWKICFYGWDLKLLFILHVAQLQRANVRCGFVSHFLRGDCRYKLCQVRWKTHILEQPREMNWVFVCVKVVRWASLKWLAVFLSITTISALHNNPGWSSRTTTTICEKKQRKLSKYRQSGVAINNNKFRSA
jgi:hypothetical protein